MPNPESVTPESVTITLTVQANSLSLAAQGTTPPSQTTIDSFCALSDTNSGNGSTLEEFVSNVYLNQDVIWTGATAAPNGTDIGFDVGIDSIEYEADIDNDVNFFPTGTVTGSGGRDGTVTAHVSSDPTLNGRFDVYRINFTVYSPSDTPAPNSFSFSIDPKLKGNP